MKCTLPLRQTALCLVFIMLVACHRGSAYYLERGNRLFAGGTFEEAALNYQNALKEDPRSAEAHYRLALADGKLGRANDAYRELGAAAVLAPDRDDIVIARADLALSSYSEDRRKPQFLYDQV